jgi:sec-independent protein translocase protein TatC
MVNSQTLKAKRNYAILLVFVTAALFTPPDVTTQCLMAVPLMLLYEISIRVVKLGEKKSLGIEENSGEGDTEEEA